MNWAIGDLFIWGSGDLGIWCAGAWPSGCPEIKCKCQAQA